LTPEDEHKIQKRDANNRSGWGLNRTIIGLKARLQVVSGISLLCL